MTVEIYYGIEETDWPEYPFMVVPRRANGEIAIDPSEYGMFVCQTLREATDKINAIARELGIKGYNLTVH